MTSPGDRWADGVRAAVIGGRPPTASEVSHIVGRSALALGEGGRREEEQHQTGRLLGLGPLAPLVADARVTDVLVNGDGRVWVDRGAGVEAVRLRIAPEDLRPLAVRLAGFGGRRLDDAQPWVDAQLPDGVRLHAVLPPLVGGGAHLSLRVARASPASLADLRALGMVDAAMADVVEALVASRVSFLVCGGTGSGKSTLLGGLLGLCPPTERIVLVEDVSELRPAHPHVVHLQGRPANVEGQGQVTMVDLVRQALRMRPDRLVVGEVRGAEVRELLAALNTGHPGAGTVHANGAGELPARLQALGALGGMRRDVVDAQLASGVAVVLTMGRAGSTRRVVDVGVTLTDTSGRVSVSSGAVSRAPGEFGPGPAWDRLEELLAGGLGAGRQLPVAARQLPVVGPGSAAS